MILTKSGVLSVLLDEALHHVKWHRPLVHSSKLRHVFKHRVDSTKCLDESVPIR